MKILISISASSWFEKLSKAQKQKYLESHPASKQAAGADKLRKHLDPANHAAFDALPAPEKKKLLRDASVIEQNAKFDGKSGRYAKQQIKKHLNSEIHNQTDRAVKRLKRDEAHEHLLAKDKEDKKAHTQLDAEDLDDDSDEAMGRVDSLEKTLNTKIHQYLNK